MECRYRPVQADSVNIAKNCGNTGKDLEYRVFDGEIPDGWKTLDEAVKPKRGRPKNDSGD